MNRPVRVLVLLLLGALVEALMVYAAISYLFPPSRAVFVSGSALAAVEPDVAVVAAGMSQMQVFILALIAALPGVITAVAGAILMLRKLETVHHQMNSLKDELVARAATEGQAQGIKEERERSDSTAELVAERAKADVLAERTKTDAALAKAEDGKEPGRGRDRGALGRDHEAARARQAEAGQEEGKEDAETEEGMTMQERGLGRRHAPDSRDARFPMKAALPAVPSTRKQRYWNANQWWGDQLAVPACVAYAFVHWLEDGPVMQRAGPPPVVDPLVLYHEAQLIDEWPDDVPYDGTSVRAGAKALKARGYLREYRWATSIDDVVQALLEVGPVVVGTDWTEAMFSPDDLGFVEPTGAVVGGHAYVLNGINTRSKVVRAKNSWSRQWGLDGHFLLHLDDLAHLLTGIEQPGEACLAVEIAVKGQP